MTNPSFPFRLAAIDIDDTLVGHDKHVSAANRRAIRQLQSLGCRVVLASGRRYPNMARYCRELELNDFVVATQGARVEHFQTGHVLYLASMGSSQATALVTEGLERGFSVMLWLRDRVVASCSSSLISLYERLTDDKVQFEDLSLLADEPAEKVTWLIDPPSMDATAREMQDRLTDKLLVTVTEDWSLEFSSLEASKRDGVAAVARHFQIPQHAVLAFGDGNNDASMLAWAGMGVAMPHGSETARAAARLVAPEGDVETAFARGVEAVSRLSQF